MNTSRIIGGLNNEPLLYIENLTKTFPGVKALDHMHFELYPGEVHILAGENGAGKSTLSKCILGYLKPDQGRICLGGKKLSFTSPKNDASKKPAHEMVGKEVSFTSPKDALACGISAVYQELTLIPWLNAAQNIYFHREPLYGGTGLIRTKKMKADAVGILSELGGDIDVSVPVCRLGIAQQQLVEIAKALIADPKILILDEATASLTDKQTEALFHKIEELKEKGVGIIYISHRIQEYPRIGDRVTVMRDGKYIGTRIQSELSERELIHMMVGRDVKQLYSREHKLPEHKDPACLKNEYDKARNQEVLRVVSLCDKTGKVKEVSLAINRGEIVGIAGLVGAGRTELARLLFGIDRPKKGKVILHGEDVTAQPPGKLIKKGLGLLPEDRKGQGLALRSSMRVNISSASLKKLFPGGLIRKQVEEDTASFYKDQLNIASPGTGVRAGSLSGGNQQKVVIAKWLLANTDVMIFDEPTRGIDVGAKMEIYRLMDQMATEGKAVLMISSELPELIGMCDRIYVMKEGQITGELCREEFCEERIGQLMIAGYTSDNVKK